MTPRVLVAGVGNVFLGDDGFGVEVVRHLGDLGPGVKVADFGIRGVHLAYELLDGYDLVVLVDAMPHGEPPGTVSVLEPEAAPARTDSPLVDAHGMEPGAVLTLLTTLGGQVGRLLVVGCEPASVTEHMGLSPPVSAAVPVAVQAVKELVAELKERVSHAAASAVDRRGARAGGGGSPGGGAGRGPVPQDPPDVRGADARDRVV